MQLIRKIFTITIALICFTNLPLAFALNSSLTKNSPGPEYFNGVYVGLGLGVGMTSVKQSDQVQLIMTSSVNASAFTNARLPIDMYQVSSLDTMIKGTLFAGIGTAFKFFYLGGEVFVDGSGYRTTNTSSVDLSASAETLIVNPRPVLGFNQSITRTTTVTLNNIQFGLDFRPGFLLTPSLLLYGRVGVGYSDMEATSSISSSGSDINVPPFTFNLPVVASVNKSGAFLRAGGGVEQYINAHWSFRADYIFTYYGVYTLNSTGTTMDTALPNPDLFTLNNSEQFKIYNNAVMFSTSYYFS